MYTVHTSTFPFKDNHLRIWVSTLVCLSDHFRSSWRLGQNRTPRMQTVPSLQWKGLGRRTPPLQTPSRTSSLLSKLIFVLAICSYLATAFFKVSIPRQWDTMTGISSAHADTFAQRGSAERMLRRTRLAFSSLSQRSRGSKAKTLGGGDRGQPCRADCSIRKASERFSFTCTIACGLWYI